MTDIQKFGPPVFIISPTKRSGTNYLKNLICRSEDCYSPGPIWEDDFLRKSHLLSDYVDFTFEQWNPGWHVEELLVDRSQLTQRFGDVFLNVLTEQFHNTPEKRKQFERDADTLKTRPYRLVSKTPRADNLEMFPDLFPSAYLILLVRDGRAVTRSGQNSFSKPFDCAVREWATAMCTIEDFTNSPKFNPDLHRLVRFEDFVENPEQELRKLFEFCNIDQEQFDWEGLDTMPVIGSSTLRADGGDVHWKPVPKTKDFDPIKRANSLTAFQASHFAYLSGKAGKFAGYDTPKVKTSWYVAHIARSVLFLPVWGAWRVSRNAKNEGWRTLKRLFGMKA